MGQIITVTILNVVRLWDSVLMPHISLIHRSLFQACTFENKQKQKKQKLKPMLDTFTILVLSTMAWQFHT